MNTKAFAFCLLALVAPATTRAADIGPSDFTKPIFTKAGAPVCRTEEGLENFLQHVRAGEHVDWSRAALDYGCAQVFDGLEVTVLRTEGFVDRRSRIDIKDGWSDRWTATWMLRN